MRVGSGVFEGNYTSASRFENGTGTNPDELLAAAEAGCFSMALSLDLEEAGYTLDYVNTVAHIHLDKDAKGFTITRIDLDTEARVPGISAEQFQQVAGKTKETCPVSRALKAIEIRLSAKLV
jgi:osmotically inducible protein OsmC